MLMIKRIRRKVMPTMMSMLLALSLVQVPVYAAEDTNEPVVINADETTGDMEVSVGNVTIENGEETAVKVYDVGQEVVLETGSITNESDGGNGLEFEVYDGGKTTINIDGDVDAKSSGIIGKTFGEGSETGLAVKGEIEGDNYGLAVLAGNGGINYVSVEGEIEGEEAGKEEDYNSGLEAVAQSGGTNYVIVKGEVEGEKIGLSEYAEGDGKNYIAVEGEVKGDFVGVWQIPKEEESEGGLNGLYMVGDITGGQCGTIQEVNDNGKNITIVKGNVIGTDMTGAECFAYGNGENILIVGGDIKGKEAGLVLGAPDKDRNVVIVEGTISGGSYGIVTDGETGNEGSSGKVFVWRVESGQGNPIALKQIDEEKEIFEEDKAQMADIHYIIKIGQPDKGAILTATAEDGSALATVIGIDENNPWSFADEGETVLLKIDVEDKYTLKKVYGAEGREMQLTQDANGNYYVVVPRGGGVYFWVELSGPGSSEDEIVKSTDNQGWTVSDGSALFEQQALQQINAAPVGGTVYLAGLPVTGLSPATVAALLARPDLTVSITYVFQGVTYMITIPANTDLRPLMNAAGGIDLAKLVTTFPSTPV